MNLLETIFARLVPIQPHLSHCFELSIARVTAFCPNYRIRFADRSIIETNTFYLTPREHEIVQLPRAIKRYSEYFSKICGTEER